jgi:hypothetical protein
MTPEQERIAAALRKGVTAVRPEMLVRNKAGDVLAILDALKTEKERADELAAQLAAIPADHAE